MVSPGGDPMIFIPLRDTLRGFVLVVVISVLAIRAALKVDPAEAIGG
jgi:hypothetical protein